MGQLGGTYLTVIYLIELTRYVGGFNDYLFLYVGIKLGTSGWVDNGEIVDN